LIPIVNLIPCGNSRISRLAERRALRQLFSYQIHQSVIFKMVLCDILCVLIFDNGGCFFFSRKSSRKSALSGRMTRVGAGTLLAVWLVMSISGAEGIELAGGEAGPRGETVPQGVYNQQSA
jgi:hypothetical protein